MLFDNCKNSRYKGNVGLAMAIAYFTKEEYLVSLPLVDIDDYDLIVDMGKKGLKKVQAKTTEYITRHGIYQILLKTCGGNQSFNTVKRFDGTKVDFIFAVTEEGTMYLIPTNKNTPKATMNLGPDRAKYIVMF